MKVSVQDIWEGLQLPSVTREDSFREPSIMVTADFMWERLQVVINRATTRSTLNMVQKIMEFIVQQKRRSERTISLMLPPEMAAAKALAAYREEQRRAEEGKKGRSQDIRHHWLWAMKVGSVRLMQALGICVQGEHHTVSLGGKINISGGNVCIVCFHGPSFREMEWAVFNVDLASASFSTQAIPGFGSGGAVRGEVEEASTTRVRICQQICTLSLGQEGGAQTELAAVYRVSSSSVPSLTATNIVDWLSLVCIDHHIHPSMLANAAPSAQSKLIKHHRRMTIQPILALPAFTVQLINDHFWPVALSMGAPMGDGPSSVPVVECSLNSQFLAGISVTTTVDHYLFLHDVIKGYIEYLEKHNSTVCT